MSAGAANLGHRPSIRSRPGELRAGRLSVAALASLGAGAVHAAAIGVHSEHTAAVVAFTAVAVFQLGWGAVALTISTRRVALVGVVGNGATIAGWVMAKSIGIWFVAGLDEAEGVQLADGLAAVLALLAVAGSLARLFESPRRPVGRETRPAVLAGAAVIVAALAVPAMASAGSHEHASPEHARPEHAGPERGHDSAAAGSTHEHAGQSGAVEQAVPPKPYDPTKPIDLGGVEGVTPEQQARAESLLTMTIARLPRYTDTATAEADGFHSVGDASTGDEHYVNWSYVNDGRILDPDYPESLVYQVRGGVKTLVAAMFMLPDGSTLDTVPDVGGPLTQWHIHDDICFTADPVAPRIAGIIGVGSACRPPTVKKAAMPMLHVWIVPHRCGPFAALDGIGGGQIKAGEQRLCDHVHGAA